MSEANNSTCNRTPFLSDEKCYRGNVDITEFSDFPICRLINPTQPIVPVPTSDIPIPPFSPPPCSCIDINVQSRSISVVDVSDPDIGVIFKSEGDCCDGTYTAYVDMSIPCVPFGIKGGDRSYSISISTSCVATSPSGWFKPGITKKGCTLNISPSMSLVLPAERYYTFKNSNVTFNQCTVSAPQGTLEWETTALTCRGTQLTPKLSLTLPSVTVCNAKTTTTGGLGKKSTLTFTGISQDACGTTICPDVSLDIPCPVTDAAPLTIRTRTIWMDQDKHETKYDYVISNIKAYTLQGYSIVYPKCGALDDPFCFQEALVYGVTTCLSDVTTQKSIGIYPTQMDSDVIQLELGTLAMSIAKKFPRLFWGACQQTQQALICAVDTLVQDPALINWLRGLIQRTILYRDSSDPCVLKSKSQDFDITLPCPLPPEDIKIHRWLKWRDPEYDDSEGAADCSDTITILRSNDNCSFDTLNKIYKDTDCYDEYIENDALILGIATPRIRTRGITLTKFTDSYTQKYKTVGLSLEACYCTKYIGTDGSYGYMGSCRNGCPDSLCPCCKSNIIEHGLCKVVRFKSDQCANIVVHVDQVNCKTKYDYSSSDEEGDCGVEITFGVRYT